MNVPFMVPCVPVENVGHGHIAFGAWHYQVTDEVSGVSHGNQD